MNVGNDTISGVLSSSTLPAENTTSILTLPKTEAQEVFEQLSPDEQESVISNGILILLVLLTLSLFGAHTLRRFKVQVIQLPVLATLSGMIVGFLLRVVFHQETILENILAFNDDIFFILLLPPIIFESGFSMDAFKRAVMFKNIGTILWFAFFCTLVSFFVVGIGMYLAGVLRLCTALTIHEAFAFGALISATDPVSVLTLFKDLQADPTLDALIGGESLLNDAIAIVLYRAIVSASNKSFAEYFTNFLIVFVMSFVVGVAIALSSALVYKYMDFHIAENQTLEAALVVVIPWVAYLAADGLGYSGVVAILFCGISMSSYTVPNLSDPGKLVAKSVFSALAFLSETVVFVFLGLAVFSFNQEWGHVGMLLCTLIVVSLARVVSVYSTAAVVNVFRRNDKISGNKTITIVICGLRGAIAFALSLRARKDFAGGAGRDILTSSLFYALLTIVVLGSMLVPALEGLDVRKYSNDRTLDYDVVTPTPGGRQAFDVSNMRLLESGKHCGLIKKLMMILHTRIMLPFFTHQDIPTNVSNETSYYDRRSSSLDQGSDVSENCPFGPVKNMKKVSVILSDDIAVPTSSSIEPKKFGVSNIQTKGQQTAEQRRTPKPPAFDDLPVVPHTPTHPQTLQYGAVYESPPNSPRRSISWSDLQDFHHVTHSNTRSIG
eukprot:GHVR01147476.1.p1 GENE.GHVR01147476.1~~GHVR01147476.1.p1  ORF type:complete len:665 (-),score=58.10 GHVR01147476.1:891-2885(-)